MSNTRIIAEMEDNANAFLNLLNENEEDKLNSKRRLDLETQVYWESENLTLEKQKKMQVAVTLELEPYTPKRETSMMEDGRGMVHEVVDNGDSYTGQVHRLVRVQRRIWKNGRQVKKYRDICDCRVHLLKSRVDAENRVACPNCGGLGTVESYVDGCDYCGARFAVNYFKSKVAGFSLVESLTERANGISKRMFVTYIVGFLVLFFAMWGMPFGLQAGYGTGFGAGFAVFGVMEKMFFTVFKMFFIMFFTTLALKIFIFPQNQGKNANVVRERIPEFDETEFRQDLEYRLKALLMAGDGRCLGGISDCDLSEFIEAHGDVFDMSISGIKYLSASFHQATGDDCISLVATVKLYRLRGSFVSESYENITLHVARQRTAHVSPCVVRQYKCSSCGNAINIFDGGKCDYCGTELDKFSLGWVVQGCSWEKKMNTYRVIPVAVGIISILILII